MATESYQGRLELTWTNKQFRLLAHEDGTYEWLAGSDYRVAEVRLLHDAARVGEVHSEATRAKDNLLIRGDALHALTSLIELPQFAREYVGKVKLAYLDPPFNTQQLFQQYDDALEHSVWLTMMRDRIQQIHTLLSPLGSIWVHLDDSEMAYCRVVLDEVFGRENFVATIIWEKIATRDNRTDIHTTHDYILVFAQSKQAWSKTRNLLPYGEEQSRRYENPDNDPRGPWQSGPAHAKAGPGRRAEQFYTITLPGGRKINPPPGRCWVYTRERFEELVKDNRIWFGANGDNAPRVKSFFAERTTHGLVPLTIWPHKEVGHNGVAKEETKALSTGRPFDTPKPERLMERIIHIASDCGDVVLDCFAGSGTTAAVAQKMGRRWVTIEWSRETVETYALPRLMKVVKGEDRGGITEGAGWSGGGGFRVLDVAPSMFKSEHGAVVLAEWAVNGKLAEATAAQLGYSFEPDPPFCGIRGRTRLAVVDGLVNAGVISLLLRPLPEGQRLLVCGTAVDPAARVLIRESRPGSNVRKIPASILDEYRDELRWTAVQVLADDEAPAAAEVMR